MKNSVDPQLSEEKSYQANHRSKGLIEIHGKPFLYYLINNASKAGFESIYIITGEDASQFRSALSNQTDLKNPRHPIRYPIHSLRKSKTIWNRRCSISVFRAISRAKK
jgi:NDP-sugar pyrophosphorylase family protein